MRKFLVQFLFLTIGGQSLLNFALGDPFQFLVFGKLWEPLHVALFGTFYLWLITYPLEDRTAALNTSRLPFFLKAFYLLSGVSLLLGVIRGMRADHRILLNDAETFFWIYVLIAIGWSLQLKRSDWEKVWQLLSWPALLLAVLSIPYVIGQRILGLTIPGYLYYSEFFLIALGFLIYFVRVIILKSPKRSERLILILITVAIGLDLNKAVLLSLGVAVMLLLLFHTRPKQESDKQRNAGTPLGRWIAFGLPLAYGFALTLFLGRATSFTLVNSYYNDRWENRILRRDTGDISGGRFLLWKQSWYWLQRQPWRGYGIGFRLGGDREAREVTSGPGISPHNHFLYLFLALGIPGASLIVVALICLVVFMTKTINRSGADPNLLLPCWGFVLFMLTYGLVGMWNISSTGYTLLGMGLGVVLRLSLQPSRVAEPGSANPTWPRQTFDFPPNDSLGVEG